MEYRYYTADVFTDKAFGGAQIAVFPEADKLDSNTMQRIASEINLSETVFLSQCEAPSSIGLSKRMRVFTPYQELDFAGHPIIAAAYILTKTGQISSKDETAITFEQNIGPIKAYVSNTLEGSPFIQYSMTCKASVDSFVPGNQELSEILSLSNSSEISSANFHSKLITTESSYLVIPCDNLESLQNAHFDAKAWARSSAPSTNAGHLLLFSKSTYTSKANFHLRLLGPTIGDEDPPVGSALTAFSSYLASFHSLRQGTYTFAVERGTPDTRLSLLQVEMDNKENQTIVLRIGGPAVLMTQSTLYL
ncbi:MAG: hypothetical protein COB04_13470 [Gammaproteobacteria bacterium]|nr:MAG: hypothetical protein COB04_13470 [Gammaproteobacteria bacterium]